MHVFSPPSLTEAHYGFSKEISYGPMLLASVGLQCPTSSVPHLGDIRELPCLAQGAGLRSSQEHAFRCQFKTCYTDSKYHQFRPQTYKHI